MRGFLRPAVGLTCLFVLAGTGCSAQAGQAAQGAAAAPRESASQTPSAATAYAPYVSATEASGNDSAGSPSVYNLAFVIADGSDCTPSWNGTAAVGDASVKSRVSALKKNGAKVRVSFGGASGKELAEACSTAAKLAAAYGSALDAAGSSLADFDIEGDALTDSDSVRLRSEAIALLQKQRSDLAVSFTLPVMPSGLDDGGVALLESANDHAVQVSTVNIMTMNYAESYDGDMGQYAITSAKAAQAQLKSVFGTSDSTAWGALALTSMIGTNDVAGETFTLSDAAEVREFAESKGVSWVSMWATFRDQQCEEGDDALTNCSGVRQGAGDFGEAFSG
ncbi:chitinase [Streptomyces griseorubiginosus]|uniref:chitinase n=1 Tax=Streptomyces griseorubiginosus TaxID=67304 RepID=UPI00363A9C5E